LNLEEATKKKRKKELPSFKSRSMSEPTPQRKNGTDKKIRGERGKKEKEGGGGEATELISRFCKQKKEKKKKGGDSPLVLSS